MTHQTHGKGSVNHLGGEEPTNFQLYGVLVVTAVEAKILPDKRLSILSSLTKEPLWSWPLYSCGDFIPEKKWMRARLDWHIYIFVVVIVPLRAYKRTGHTVPKTSFPHLYCQRKQAKAKPGPQQQVGRRFDAEYWNQCRTCTERLATSKVEELSGSCQVDIWTHPRDTRVGVSPRMFPERLNWDRNAYCKDK